MAVTVHVIRHTNPNNDAEGTDAAGYDNYAKLVDAAVGSTTAALTEIASAWDPVTNSIVTTVLIFSA